MHPLFAVAAMCCAIGGRVHGDAGPIGGARIELSGQVPASVHSGADGHWRVVVPPGSYRITVDASGYRRSVVDELVLRAPADVDTLLARSALPKEIGRVTVDGRLAPSRATVPTRVLSSEELALSGTDRIVDALAAAPSLTIARPDGSGGPVVVAMRGPDPSETLVELDGQVLNDANTGDLDLAQFDPNAFASIQLSEGLGPSERSESNTIGGTVDLVTLRPTAARHERMTLWGGTYGATGLSTDATGTLKRLGYAFAYHQDQNPGPVSNLPVRMQDAAGTLVPLTLNSGVHAATALADLEYALSRATSLRVRYFSGRNSRDESAAQAAPVDPNQQGTGDVFTGPGTQFDRQRLDATLVALHTRAAGGDLDVSYAASGHALSNTGIAQTPYDFSYTDKLGTAQASWTRAGERSTLTLGSYLRAESLDSPDQFTSVLRERSGATYVRGNLAVSNGVRLSAALTNSVYQTFGASLDWRAGASIDLGAATTLRVAAGTGFRAPLLAERFTLPLSDLAPDVNCVGANGNAGLRPEHAVEYELGVAHRFDARTTVDATAYRTNLRDPIENEYPLGTTCPSGPDGTPIETNAVAQTYPINVGNAVYEGGTLIAVRRLSPTLYARAAYGVNTAYPKNLPLTVANPTSGANLVNGLQFQRIPFHNASLLLTERTPTWHADVRVAYRGINNELNAGPYAVLDAAVGTRVRDGVDVTLSGSNLTGAASGRFTLVGLGVPYPVPGGALATDRYVLPPAQLRLSLSIER